MARVYDKQAQKERLSFQNVDSEEINESEESEDLESGCQEKIKESSPVHEPGTSNAGDTLSPDDESPDSNSSEGTDDEQGSTALVTDTNSPTVADEADDDQVDEEDESPPQNMVRFVIGQVCNSPAFWVGFFVGLFIYVMYLLRELFGFDVINNDPKLKAADS